LDQASSPIGTQSLDVLFTSEEKAHPLGESVEWAFSLAFFVFYGISAYFIVFLFRDLG
jgi:hypothetical protein